MSHLGMTRPHTGACAHRRSAGGIGSKTVNGSAYGFSGTPPPQADIRRNNPQPWTLRGQRPTSARQTVNRSAYRFSSNAAPASENPAQARHSKCRAQTRAGPASPAGPALVSSDSCCLRSHLVPACGAVRCGGRLVGRPAHAPARARPQSYAGLHSKLAALRRHRKPTSVAHSQPGGSPSSVETVDMSAAPFNSGQLRVLRLPLVGVSISLAPRSVNPTRTGHSRRPWWRSRRHEIFIQL
jgi:hypothetical protein